jgi:Phosphate-induced protein 1 conserved region
MLLEMESEMQLLKQVCLTAALTLAMGTTYAAGVQIDDETEFKPTGRGVGEVDHHPDSKVRNKAARAAATNGITYHGGPVMLGTTKVYYIWYGNWAGDTTPTILTDLANSIGGSPYNNINTTYYQGTSTKSFVSNSVSFLGATSTADTAYGKSLSDANIQSLVSDAISSGRLPKDTNGLYFVLTAKDVTASSGFCTQYCGWHTHATIAGSNIKYSFVGNPATQCPAGCGVNSPSPNGNGGADAMASILSHELVETVSDPDLNAWYDRSGNENADKCAYTYGTTYTSANGAVANMKMGTRDYKIQQNWVNAAGGKCAKQYP